MKRTLPSNSVLAAWLILIAAIICMGQQPPDFRVDVDLVSVGCSVTKGGKPVGDMRLEDFVLRDGGKVRRIEHLWREDLPLTIGLLADVSGSEDSFIGHHRQALTQFLEKVVRPQDQAFLITIAEDVRLITEATSSIDELRNGVERIGERPSPGEVLGDCLGPPQTIAGQYFPHFCSTALWNGVYFTALRKMNNVTGRKALILFTDGLDRTSPHTLSDAIEAAQRTDTRVYTIQNVTALGYIDFRHTATAALKLRRLAGETGGRAFGARGNPAATFAQIEEELRTMYVLGFRLPVNERNGGPHKLEIKSNRAGVEVRARKQYVE